mgnify:CR=1 FL=1
MPPNQIPVSEGGKRILNTIKDELFPVIKRLKDILVRVQKVRISYQLYSTTLSNLETEYALVSGDFFEVVRKLQTPDLLFKGLVDNPQYVADYFQYQEAFQKNIEQGLNYVEIIDRTLDRKIQNIQSNKTFLISVTAIVISILSIFWSPYFGKASTGFGGFEGDVIKTLKLPCNS